MRFDTFQGERVCVVFYEKGREDCIHGTWCRKICEHCGDWEPIEKEKREQTYYETRCKKCQRSITLAKEPDEDTICLRCLGSDDGISNRGGVH